MKVKERVFFQDLLLKENVERIWGDISPAVELRLSVKKKKKTVQLLRIFTSQACSILDRIVT